MCDCGDGFRWDSSVDACVDLDECSDTLLCSKANSVCMNTNGGYLCECQSGYAEDDFGNCEDLNECSESGMETCKWAGATCVNALDGYSCDCGPGRILQGFSCMEEDNECGDNSPCDNNALCSIEDGSYSCDCNAGFFGDGTLCFSSSDACTAGISATACSQAGGSPSLAPNVILLTSLILVISLSLLH